LCTHGLGFVWCREPLIPRLMPPFAARSSLRDRATDAKIPGFHADARRFEHGNMNYGCVHALKAAIDFIGDVGVPQIHSRVLALTGQLMDLIERKGLPCITPRAAGERAGIVTIGMNDAPRRRDELLRKRFVVSDVADGLRIAPHFYNTERELEALVDAL
jgi:selenocysteine lyase/cysteine desulfurase